MKRSPAAIRSPFLSLSLASAVSYSLVRKGKQHIRGVEAPGMYPSRRRKKGRFSRFMAGTELWRCERSGNPKMCTAGRMSEEPPCVCQRIESKTWVVFVYFLRFMLRRTLLGFEKLFLANIIDFRKCMFWIVYFMIK